MSQWALFLKTYECINNFMLSSTYYIKNLTSTISSIISDNSPLITNFLKRQLWIFLQISANGVEWAFLILSHVMSTSSSSQNRANFLVILLMPGSNKHSSVQFPFVQNVRLGYNELARNQDQNLQRRFSQNGSWSLSEMNILWAFQKLKRYSSFHQYSLWSSWPRNDFVQLSSPLKNNREPLFWAFPDSLQLNCSFVDKFSWGDRSLWLSSKTILDNSYWISYFFKNYQQQFNRNQSLF